MKAQTKSFNMRVRVAGLSSQNVDEFLSAAPSMQPQCSVERARVRHLARHPEVNLNLQTMVGILNKSSNQALHYSPAHLYLLMSRSSCNKGRKVNTGVHKCAYWNHLEVARVTPRTLIDLDYKDEHIKLQLFLVFTIRTYISDSLDKYVANTGSVPNCCPLGQTKNINKTHMVRTLGPK